MIIIFNFLLCLEFVGDSNSPLSHGGHIGYDVCILGIKSRRCVFNFSGLQLIMLNKIIAVCSRLCSNNRSKGKLGITFHRFPVDKYAKENWIIRIRRYVGKNFRLVIVVYDFKLCKLYLKSVCSGLQSNLID